MQKLKFLFISLVSFICFASAGAQSLDRINIDINQVDVNVTRNQEHYRDLMNRFIKADTTLRLDELATIYYGFPYTYDYTYDPTADYSEIIELCNNMNYAKALPLVREELKRNPVSIKLLSEAVAGCAFSENTDDLMAAQDYQNRLDMLVTTIMATGKGYKENKPFRVISSADAKAIMTYALGVEEDKWQTAVDNNILAFLFHFKGHGRDNLLYFDIAPEVNFLKQ
ncbi:MAG: DUF4919 domain-containing protein [Muribaculaceae bacterium]|nr:DUF4919 domain-containing protein [Muribaculaceae bacterium]